MFYGCKNLTSIEIPNGVVSIGENAFTFCTGLHDIYCYAEHVPEIDNAAFVSVNLENAILHVPASALDAYTTTAPWSNFSNIVALTEEDYADGISPLRPPLNGEKCNAIYNLQGQRIKTLQKGLNIVDGKKVMVK